MSDPEYTLTESDGTYHLALHYDDGRNKIREVSEPLANLLSD